MSLFAEDKAFARRLLRGDEEAFDELFAVYAQRVYRFVLARLRDPELAEEVVQSTLIGVIPRLGGYRGEASLTTWLCSFARFELTALQRRRGREPAALGTAERIDDDPALAAALELIATSPAEGPEQRLLSSELAHLVQQLLDRLPGRYGDLLEWKYAEGLSVREIAVRLGTSATAAQSGLARARRAFRDGFAEVVASYRGAAYRGAAAQAGEKGV